MTYYQNWRATGSWNIQIYENSQISKKLYVNLRLLNDYRLIILIKMNKKAYMWVCFIFKIGDAISMRIYFPTVHALKRKSRFACLLHLQCWRYSICRHRSFFVHLNRYRDTAYADIETFLFVLIGIINP